jgi:hypothetical protein
MVTHHSILRGTLICGLVILILPCIEVPPEIWSTFDESITDGFGSLLGFLKGGCTHEEVLQWTTGRGEIKTGCTCQAEVGPL